MKINTEIVQKIFIVTCEGSRLDASFAKSFFDSMQGFIKKGHMDIILDLSSVKFVDSTGLGAIVRALKEIGGRGQLLLCGVNDMVLSLLKMTRLDDVFIQAIDRVAALKMLAVAPAPVEAQKMPQAADCGTSAGLSNRPCLGDPTITTLEMEGGGVVHGIAEGEKRGFRRISNKEILSEEIIVYCTNQETGKCSTAVILDISPSGLLVISPAALAVGTEFIVEGRIGRNFRLRERAVISNGREGKYGFEFVKPSPETTSFLHQLTGAVMLKVKGKLVS